MEKRKGERTRKDKKQTLGQKERKSRKWNGKVETRGKKRKEVGKIKTKREKSITEKGKGCKNAPVTGSLAVRPQPGNKPQLLPTFAICVLCLAPAGAAELFGTPVKLPSQEAAQLRLSVDLYRQKTWLGPGSRESSVSSGNWYVLLIV